VEGLNASDLSPGQPSTYVSLLKRMAVELSSGGTFQSSSSTTTTTTTNHHGKKSKRLESLLRRGQLVVTDAWCVYSSPRPSAVWARDAYAFAEKLSLKTNTTTTNTTTTNNNSGTMMDRVPLPKALRALTLGPGALDETKETKKDDTTKNQTNASLSALGWLQNAMSSSSSSKPEDGSTKKSHSSRPPFPLPTSDAQNRIAELLLTRNYPAVVCEGPPGTGKTHTIANIVCAYLCQGKRVLVTSKGAPALSVLRERLPDCVQELCVDVSKSESSGMRQLQQTVERLANKVAWVNTERELGKSNALKVCYGTSLHQFACKQMREESRISIGGEIWRLTD
jgi:primosomal protein N'